MPYLQSFNRFRRTQRLSVLQRTLPDAGPWVTGASEKYVVSDPIFDERRNRKADGDRKTIILDLNETDDSDR